MWGIIPAAGLGSRIQPLAFSKELLPVCGRSNGVPSQPRAVSDFLVERLVAGGATKLCFVISPGKSDILEYYGGSAHSVPVCYCVQPRATGLCDAIFRALPVIGPGSAVMVGLPDTIWFPADALTSLPDDRLSFLLFPVRNPAQFDAVVTDAADRVLEIQVKQPNPETNWVWGAFKMPGFIFQQLFDLWRARGEHDVYIGTLVNAWLKLGGEACGVRAGSSYLDVGTVEGYLEATRLLSGLQESDAAQVAT